MAETLRGIRGVALAALFAFAALLAVSRPGLAEEPAAIRLGMTAGFTGATRAMAVELYRGAMAMIDRQNRDGGVDGRKLELLAADDGYEPDPAIENCVRFLDSDGVVALFSALGTPTVSRVLPMLRVHAAKDARLFFPVTGLEASRLPPYVAFAYNLRASYRQEIEALVEAFAKRGLSRIAICYQADAFGRSGWDGAGRALGRRGRSLCGEATFARLATAQADMSAQARILAAARPEAVLLIGPAPACAAVIRDMRRQGLAMPLGVVSFAGGEVLLHELADQGRRVGLNLEDGLIFSQVVPSWRNGTLAAARDYRRDLAAMGDRHAPPGGWTGLHGDGSSVGFEGYLNARLLITVLRAMPDPRDRRELDAAAASLHGVDIGLGLPLSLDGPQHQALCKVYLATAAHGTLVPLEEMTVASGE